MKPYTKVLDWQPPMAKWFVGGQTNASAACLDQQIAAGSGEKTAIVWVGEPSGERRDIHLPRAPCGGLPIRRGPARSSA